MADLTANQRYFDSAIRHAIGVRRYSTGLSKEVADLLAKADQDLVRQLRKRLPKLKGVGLSVTDKRLKALLADIREMRLAVMKKANLKVRGELLEYSKLEVQFEARLMENAIPIEMQFATVNAKTLRSIVTTQPFNGGSLGQWFETLKRADQRRLTQSIQLGMAQGETTDQIVRRVAGTRAKKFKDGALSITRRDAQTVVRTATNHVSNNAREKVWEENEDIIAYKRWTSTLDGRTTPICRARDGHGVPIGNKRLPKGVPPLEPKGARPPAHPACRSIFVASIDGVGVVGQRPTVTDTRTRKKREIDFRKIAKEKGIPIQQVRREWAEKNVGRTPAKTTYNSFLKRQSAKFQDDVLGKTKGKLFRKGGLDVDEFVDPRGKELTLSQLAKTKPEAFEKAGLVAEDFE